MAAVNTGESEDQKDSQDIGVVQEMDELVELQVAEEARLEALFEEYKASRGLENDETLTIFFKLFDMWIGLYRLNKCSAALDEILPVCRKRDNTSFLIKAVQATAFTKWKQSRFREAVALFHEMEGMVGANAALCENIGHTYSSMGEFDKAENYFIQALEKMSEAERIGNEGNRAGVLLGLGLIKERQNDFDKALPFCREAQDLYRRRAHGKPSSLIAKAGMSIAKILLKLADQSPDKKDSLEEEAERCCHENVQIFEVTCGEDSPLTASALRGLGEVQLRRGLRKEAQTSFARSYWLEAIKDSFDLLLIMEVHNMLVDAHTRGNGGELDRAAFPKYFPTVEKAIERVRQMPQDGNAGAYYKSAAEIMAFGTDYARSSALLEEAIMLLQAEDKPIVISLINQCKGLKEFCDSQVVAAKDAKNT